MHPATLPLAHEIHRVLPRLSRLRSLDDHLPVLARRGVIRDAAGRPHLAGTLVRTRPLRLLRRRLFRRRLFRRRLARRLPGFVLALALARRPTLGRRTARPRREWTPSPHRCGKLGRWGKLKFAPRTCTAPRKPPGQADRATSARVRDQRAQPGSRIPRQGRRFVLCVLCWSGATRWGLR